MAFSSLFASIGYVDIYIAIFLFFLESWGLGHTNKNDLPINFPVLGTFPSLLLNVHRIHEWATQFLPRTGGTFLLKGLWFTNMDILATTDPANVHYIMSVNFPNFPEGPAFKKVFDVLGDGIFNSDLDLWKNQRKLNRELINHQRFHKFLVKTTWDKVKNSLVPVLKFMAKEDRIVDLQDVFKRFTFDTTCKLVTDFDPGCLSLELPDVSFLNAMDDAIDNTFVRNLLPESIWKLQKRFGVGHEKKLKKAVEVLDQVIGKYISMKHEELSKGEKPNEEEDGFDLLTACIVNEGERTTGLKFDKFMRDTIINFMFAGRDGLSSFLTWFIWLVFTHPEVEKNIREELQEIIPTGEAEKMRFFTTDELKNVVYLNAALYESLRLYPPIPLQQMNPQEHDILPSRHHVHSKMRVFIPLYV